MGFFSTLILGAILLLVCMGLLRVSANLNRVAKAIEESNRLKIK